ncbi:MAG: hypothetical protein AB1757_24890 [Acidobacteriota bacterium]
MNIQSKSKKHGMVYFDSISAKEFESRLEVPDGRNPNQNAWLTITINYSLNFADSKNRVAGVIVEKNGKYYAKDSDNELFPIKDWDFKSQIEFNRRFRQGEKFWNYKFLLITPKDYNAFDYTSWAGPGWICRPNIICLFRLGSGLSPTHLPLTVVRPDPTWWDNLVGNSFRSHSRLYDEEDVKTKTLWHELGHALDQLHIKALMGNQQCLVDINKDDCYDTPSGMDENIMGRGTGLATVNAKPWQELIEAHTGIPKFKWLVTTATNTPPRKLQMAFQVRGVMPQVW